MLLDRKKIIRQGGPHGRHQTHVIPTRLPQTGRRQQHGRAAGGLRRRRTRRRAHGCPSGRRRKQRAGGDTTATLTIFDFGGDADKKIYADAHARFKKKYPNVTIADNFTPVTTWSEYSNKITTQMAGGQSPDIINIAIEGARLLVKKGLLQPLDEFAANDPSGKELIDDVAPALSAPFKIDGKIWYMPHSWNNMVIYYNTKIFKDAGIEPPKPDWTWDDFLGIAKKLTTGSGADQVFGFGIPNFNFGLQPVAADQRHHPAQRRLDRLEPERPEGGRGDDLRARSGACPQSLAGRRGREQRSALRIW